MITPARQIVWLLSGSLTLPGCVVLPSVESRLWTEASTPSITLITDADEKTAAELAEGLEWYRAIMMGVADLEFGPPPLPSAIFVFQRHSMYRMFMERETGGEFHQGPYANYLIVDGSRGRYETFRTACHEFIHLTLSDSPDLVYPLWYHEGLATLLSGLYPRDEDLWIGSVSRAWVSWLIEEHFVPLESLFSTEVTSDIYLNREDQKYFYGTAWAVVHYLLIGAPERRDQLRRYLELWKQGEPVGDALHTAFGMGFPEFEGRVKTYLGVRSLPVLVLPAVDLKIPARALVRELPSVEAFQRLAQLAARLGQLDLAEELLRSALQRSSTHAASHAWLGVVLARQERFDEANASISRALELEPHDALIHSLSGTSWLHRARTERSAEALRMAQEQYRASLEIEPYRPDAHSGLAQTYLPDLGEPGDLGAGIEAAETALQIVPTSPRIAYVLARLYSKAGREAEAVPLLRLAIHHGEDAEMVADARKHLEEIEKTSSH